MVINKTKWVDKYKFHCEKKVKKLCEMNKLIDKNIKFNHFWVFFYFVIWYNIKLSFLLLFVHFSNNQYQKNIQKKSTAILNKKVLQKS